MKIIVKTQFGDIEFNYEHTPITSKEQALKVFNVAYDIQNSCHDIIYKKAKADIQDNLAELQTLVRDLGLSKDDSGIKILTDMFEKV